MPLRYVLFTEEVKMMDSRIDVVYLDAAAQGTRMLNEKGFQPDGDSGDISLLDPKTGLVYISGHMLHRPFPYKDLTEYRPQDMSVLELDGTVISDWSEPTCEFAMHLAIYKARPDVRAVVHTHAPWSSVYAIAGMDIPCTLAEHVDNLGYEIRCAKYAGAGEQILADYVVEALGTNNAALLANHGAVTVGESLAVAFRRASYLENIAQKTIFAKLLGNVNDIPKDWVYADWLVKKMSQS